MEAVARANLPTRGARLRAVAAASAGGLAAWLAIDFGAHAGGRVRPCSRRAVWGWGCVAYLLVERRVPNYVVLYLAAALACAAGAFL